MNTKDISKGKGENLKKGNNCGRDARSIISGLASYRERMRKGGKIFVSFPRKGKERGGGVESDYGVLFLSP